MEQSKLKASKVIDALPGTSMTLCATAVQFAERRSMKKSPWRYPSATLTTVLEMRKGFAAVIVVVVVFATTAGSRSSHHNVSKHHKCNLRNTKQKHGKTGNALVGPTERISGARIYNAYWVSKLDK